MYNRIIKSALNIARIFKWDLETTKTLCSQLRRYKENESPFDLPYLTHDSPIQWWDCIELQENYIQQLAIYLFSICPNSASCERGFSTLGWLTGKYRLRLGVEKMESMAKMISFYWSNAKKELAFYGKNDNKLSDEELLIKIHETLIESYNNDNIETISEDNRHTISGEVIPADNVTVIIESLDLEEIINLDYQIIINSLGKIPEEEIDNLSDIHEENNNHLIISNNNININEVSGKDIFDFDNNDLLIEFGEKE